MGFGWSGWFGSALLWSGPEGSEQFQKVLAKSKKVLAGSCGSWLAVNGHAVWFQKVLVGSKRFWDVLKRFQHV